MPWLSSKDARPISSWDVLSASAVSEIERGVTRDDVTELQGLIQNYKLLPEHLAVLEAAAAACLDMDGLIGNEQARLWALGDWIGKWPATVLDLKSFDVHSITPTLLKKLKTVADQPVLQSGVTPQYNALIHRLAEWVITMHRYGETLQVMPVIFLDVDGVCHPLRPSGHALHASMEALTARAEAEWDLADGATASTVQGEFTDDCMAALAKCVHSSNARIVLSSTWRETAPQRRAVEAQCRAHRVGNVLPVVSSITPSKPGFEGGRVAEILHWVEEHQPMHWLAIDDADLSKLPPGHFVHTDPGAGLTLDDAARVVDLLCTQP